MTQLVPITNTPRAYAWGVPGGIRAVLGGSAGACAGAPSGVEVAAAGAQRPEAELWLGAHPAGPSRAVEESAPWPDLRAWEEASAQALPFLLKLLTAGSPLSLQAHPDADDARAGFEREEAAGLPADDPTRNFRDPHAKPELLLAVQDGFDALCGFRPVAEVLAVLEVVLEVTGEPAVAHWSQVLRSGPTESEGIRAALAWLLSQAADGAVAAVCDPALADTAAHDAWELASLLSRHHPADRGIAVAIMLNRVRLRAGEALWLPAGNVHSYLSGVGVELMGPSDNVLRGGLTGKHVDVAALLHVLDTTPASAPRLVGRAAGPGVTAYRPREAPGGADVPWQLLRVTGAAQVRTGSAALGLVLNGGFTLRAGGAALELRQGDAGFVDEPTTLVIEGAGELFLAST